jgi:hypothetical protein
LAEVIILYSTSKKKDFPGQEVLLCAEQWHRVALTGQKLGAAGVLRQTLRGARLYFSSTPGLHYAAVSPQ